jgi:hypothetical protein
MSSLISRNKKVLEIKVENAQQRPRLLRAGQTKVEVMISNPDFPNGKSGFNTTLIRPFGPPSPELGRREIGALLLADSSEYGGCLDAPMFANGFE